MAMHLIFWKLEWKRAYQRLPQMFAGATVLLFLAASVAFLAGNLLYSDTAAGRIAVGVVMPEEDLLTEKVISMMGSLDSVNSMCDFRYLDRSTAKKGLESGELFAVMEIPEQMVEGIMDGTNPPVRVLLPAREGVESRIFQELTEAGAEILSSAQAGIYAGGELCRIYGLETSVPQLEQELNRIFLSYSLPREDYFRYYQVSATGDIDTMTFYGISAYVLFLMMAAIPVSGYLLPWKRVMKQKLRMAGIKGAERAAARAAGLAGLYLTVSAGTGAVIIAAGSAGTGAMAIAAGSAGTGTGAIAADSAGTGAAVIAAGSALKAVLPAGPLQLCEMAAAAVLVCLAAAVLAVLLYQLAGTLLGGMMLLFLMVTLQHFLAGGFLPLVFLPASIQAASPMMPSSVLMEGVRMIVTGSYEWAAFGKLCLMIGAGLGVSAVLEGREA